jgi:FYVE/RhoGEF/PH domain-containing protein 5/6
MLSNTTLTSSSSNAHVRAMLRALPYTGEEPESGKRLKVDHFTPPVWVPDRKAPACMRCHRKFTWLVRRHHCRLCGRCVCAPCSNRVCPCTKLDETVLDNPFQTFFLGDTRSKKAANTAARACSACYEAVFPVIENSPPSQPAAGVSMGTLSGLPNWKTTKQSSFDSSVLRLLGETRDEGDEPDDLKESPDEPSNASQKRDQRRLSSPVIALQKPNVIAQSQNNANHSSRHVTPSNGPSQPTTDNNRSLGAEDAISELQKVLKKT